LAVGPFYFETRKIKQKLRLLPVHCPQDAV